jgi:UDP-glucose 4-epimerase
MMQNNTILVTGGAGYIGSHVCKALDKASYTPITFDNLSTGHQEFIKWGPFIHANLDDKEAIKEALNQFKPKAVMHFAAFSTVSESVIKPLEYYKNNFLGSLNLLEAIIETNIIPIIFSSTCAVYGNPKYVPIDETHEKNPISPYGRSKLMVEQAIEDFSVAYNIPYAILRYFNAAGASLDGSIGEFHLNETHLIPLIIETALGKREFLNIFGDDFDTYDGSAVRDYIHVEDLSVYHLNALNHLLEGKENIVLNLGRGCGFSVKEIITAAKKKFDKDFCVNIAPRRIGDPPVLINCPDKSHYLLKYKTQYSDIDTILETAMNWHSRIL